MKIISSKSFKEFVLLKKDYGTAPSTYIILVLGVVQTQLFWYNFKSEATYSMHLRIYTSIGLYNLLNYSYVKE